MVIYLIISLALIGLGALCIIPLIRLMESRPILLLWSILFAFVYSSLYDPSDLPVVSIAGINFNQMDMIGPIILGLSFPFVFIRLRDGFGRSDVLLLVFFLWSMILGLNYILGLRAFGLQVATNEFRSYFYIICIALYVATLDIETLWPKIERLVLIGAFCLFIISIIGFWDGDFSRGGRPITSSHALLILQAMLIGIFMYDRGQLNPFLIPFIVALFPLLIALQHRSVWIVTLLCFIFVFVVLPSLRGKIMKFGLIGILVFCGLCGIVFGNTMFEALADSYDEATLTGASYGTNTFLWRIQGWGGLLTGGQMDSAQDFLIGNPFGTGWGRTVLTSAGVEQVREESPHNFYVQTFLRGGGLGILAFLALYIILLRKLLYRARVDLEFRPILLCLTVVMFSQVIFYIPYGFDYVQAIFLGSGIAWLRHSETVNATI